MVPGGKPEAAQQPILLTINDENPRTERPVRFLVDGAAVPADANAYQRIVLLFNGDDTLTRSIPLACVERSKKNKVSTLPIGNPTKMDAGNARPEHQRPDCADLFTSLAVTRLPQGCGRVLWSSLKFQV